jgi:predicted nucleotidyltransferase
MPLPGFNRNGDLPPGVHLATIQQVIERFGAGTPERELVTTRLRRVYNLARATGKIERFLVFGSYVTEKPSPNDVDVVLVMQDDFSLMTCDGETRSLFDHQQADSRFGASIFWIRPSHLLQEALDDFIAHWQIKRDQTRRGIVEVSL